ncbi:hypothetical protein Tco_0598783 [Tanacetum coccineum]
MESIQNMSGCEVNQKMKYTTGSFVGKALMWWNSLIHTRGREAAVGSMSWLATEPTTIQKAMQIAGTLTDEAIRNGLIKKNPEKRGNGGEPSKDRNQRDDNKRTRTGNIFLRPQTLLGERTRVRHPSVPLVTFITHLRCHVALASTITAYDILLRIVE